MIEAHKQTDGNLSAQDLMIRCQTNREEFLRKNDSWQEGIECTAQCAMGQGHVAGRWVTVADTPGQ